MENDDQSVTLGPISDKHKQTHRPHFRDSYGCSSLQVWEEDMFFDPWPKIVQQKHQEFLSSECLTRCPRNISMVIAGKEITLPLGFFGGCFGGSDCGL